MNIKPIKPGKKNSQTEKSGKVKKSSETTDRFADMVISSIDETENIPEIDKYTSGNLGELHDYFKATVNHEINNPLFVVRGMAELIKDDTLKEIKKNILEDVDKVSSEISDFNRRDIPAVEIECKNAPIEQIEFRTDLVACYLAKVIAPMTSILRKQLDEIEKSLEIEMQDQFSEKLEVDKIRRSLNVIRNQAQRIMLIIDKLEEILPDNIEVKKYVDELKMVHLKI